MYWVSSILSADFYHFLGDCVINDVSLRHLHNEELEERTLRMEDFEELHGKKEHNVCIFDGNYETECEVNTKQI